ncbi:hypothetical protein FHS21_005660 [Phyllobacterium trifolii]|uniref:RiboL-PSP-HEPN domain-containing protein n=1 Tax=Phyllobacterium trifolii TaxID=300193 RepID=A0A839UDQ7_9HYPH|nr:hypothetical protein [Phyllobacterium trifolii]MBB3149208.1 hypothetical protein [Phyllobacterium trifolii]
MGSSKEQMHQNGLKVSFACPNADCEGHFEEEVQNASFDWGSERQSDGIGYAETSVECEICEDTFTVAVLATQTGKEVTLKGLTVADLEYIDDTFEHDYDEFLADYEPQDPFGVYTRSSKELDDLYYGSEILPRVQAPFNKMLYLQHIIAMEAYLSDRLIDIITTDSTKLLTLIGSTPSLRDRPTRLIEVAKDPDYVASTTKAHLQRFSFHDLANVAKFYKSVLNIDLFETDEHRKTLLAIIETRHDLVHRNGRDRNGNETVIDGPAVERVKEIFQGLIERIEDAYTKYKVSCFFQVLDT